VEQRAGIGQMHVIESGLELLLEGRHRAATMEHGSGLA
jgi:hypothetical protein